MSIDMVTINSIMLEHMAIERYIEVLREAVAEQATFLLQSANTWDKTHLKELKKNYLKVRDSMQALHDGLMWHCAREEKILSPVLGHLMAAGNVMEHKEIIQKLAQSLSALDETGLLGDLKPQELMATTYNVKRTVEIVCTLVGTHEANEAGMLGLLKKGLHTAQQE